MSATAIPPILDGPGCLEQITLIMPAADSALPGPSLRPVFLVIVLLVGAIVAAVVTTSGAARGHATSRPPVALVAVTDVGAPATGSRQIVEGIARDRCGQSGNAKSESKKAIPTWLANARSFDKTYTEVRQVPELVVMVLRHGSAQAGTDPRVSPAVLRRLRPTGVIER